MRLLSRLLVALAICLVSIAPLAVPVQAAEEEPYITLSPSHGVPGIEITVRGYYYLSDEWVDIYYYLGATDRIHMAEVQATSALISFTATFTIPESSKGSYNIFAAGESNSAYAEFTVKPGLTIIPEKGAVGTNATVEGHGFAEDEEDIELRYYIDSADYETTAENIEADEDGYWKKTFLIPPSSNGNHKIDAEGDESRYYQVEDATFKVTPVVNILDGPSGSIVEEPSGSVGDNITMTGNGFYAGERAIKILFAGEAVVTEVRADARGYWEEAFQVPEMPTGTYSVTAEGEWTKQRDLDALSFEIKPGILLSPDQGHVGMNLTVTGRGFATHEGVSITYDGSQVKTATTDAKGSFEVSFLIPESRHGERPVTAGDAAGNNATVLFTMESNAPDTPELVSPADGGRVGFIGKIRLTFEWSEVSDDSGVYYSLQIATSANVTATGEFADPVVSKEGLVGTTYTLEKTEALPHGTYYWIVQAVDGAENAGEWTAVYSFRAGLLPIWAFIVIIVAIAGGIGAAVYFLVIKRRIYY